MVKEQFVRTALLLGEEGLNKLKNSSVAVVGIGGVGGYCAEALIRAGIERILLIDGDVVNESNINRQIIALHSTLGQSKVSVMEKRIKDINPDAKILAKNMFLEPQNIQEAELEKYDYVADAIDDVKAKIALIEYCKNNNINIISSMGAGNKLTTDFEIADIYATRVCPLAKIIRKMLRDKGIKELKTVYSPQEPVKNQDNIIGSISFATASAGLVMAKEIISELLK